MNKIKLSEYISGLGISLVILIAGIIIKYWPPVIIGAILSIIFIYLILTDFIKK